MKFTDSKALKELDRVGSAELDEDISTYPENEREGRSDLQMLADEVSYIISLYNENDTCHNEDLAMARSILRRTKYGKQIPLRKDNLKPIYRESDILGAKWTVNEYNRLVACMKRLNKAGYYGKW